MFKTKFAQYSLVASAGLLVAFAPEAAQAANNFSNLSTNVAASLASVPGLLAAVSYLFGVILIILGIIKIKEHVEKPDQTPLKEGAIRLIIGGALFALPLLTEVVKETIEGGNAGTAQGSSTLRKVDFAVN
jgi:hypothetical protein